jgi:hypothetical protein
MWNCCDARQFISLPHKLNTQSHFLFAQSFVGSLFDLLLVFE